MYLIDVERDKIPVGVFPGLNEWLDDMNSYRSNPVSFTLAIEDDVAVGVCVHEPGHIIYLVVAETERRQGVGTTLVKNVLNAHKGSTWLRVNPYDTMAVCFFSRLGGVVDRVHIADDDVTGGAYHRMVLGTKSKRATPPEETSLVHYLANTPVFVSVAGKIV
ncbi:putative acetyltransferase [Erwinia phage vB_EamM_Phobos]|uniref:acetyltransferase n=1 Tax=Erwinia phage vB_EamM_Phobos TaxID=1883377 RepID=UPI00081C65AB|nr:acetyltransferase [Erwinia phage vB_EamM_Phobos]ANZ50275.1 putative acetyltransferase [Erwinia phage vB_EamM_Phobos]